MWVGDVGLFCCSVGTKVSSKMGFGCYWADTGKQVGWLIHASWPKSTSHRQVTWRAPKVESVFLVGAAGPTGRLVVDLKSVVVPYLVFWFCFFPYLDILLWRCIFQLGDLWLFINLVFFVFLCWNLSNFNCFFYTMFLFVELVFIHLEYLKIQIMHL
jgi:hypothetical protein